MDEQNPITEAVRKIAAGANEPVDKLKIPLFLLVASLDGEATSVPDEALLLLPQEFRRLALMSMAFGLLT